jgi:hypothetical protein
MTHNINGLSELHLQSHVDVTQNAVIVAAEVQSELCHRPE